MWVTVLLFGPYPEILHVAIQSVVWELLWREADIALATVLAVRMESSNEAPGQFRNSCFPNATTEHL